LDYDFSDEIYEMAYSLMDDILFKAVRVRYLEPGFTVVTREYVKGVKTE
jgi:hypothetical protein